jgi:four helix bundle protein
MIVRLYAALHTSTVAQVLGRQMLRSGTSVGAHHREATRARSAAEFISKLEGGLQELEETRYWLELLGEASVVAAERVAPIQHEAAELAAMMTASAKTAKRNRSSINDKR